MTTMTTRGPGGGPAPRRRDGAEPALAVAPVLGLAPDGRWRATTGRRPMPVDRRAA